MANLTVVIVESKAFYSFIDAFVQAIQNLELVGVFCGKEKY